jgi:hypothetical protein
VDNITSKHCDSAVETPFVISGLLEIGSFPLHGVPFFAQRPARRPSALFGARIYPASSSFLTVGKHVVVFERKTLGVERSLGRHFGVV